MGGSNATTDCDSAGSGAADERTRRLRARRQGRRRSCGRRRIPRWRYVDGTFIVGAPFFYPYYPYYPYYPPLYPVPYSEPPAYIEQGGCVYYYCPDYNDYYPNVSSCPSQWVPVSATASEAPQ